MTTELRVLGQEVTIRITEGGALLDTITAIQNFTFEARTRILTEGYLGETANRQDEIFDEVGGSFTVHPESQDILLLQNRIVRRAQTRVANPTIITAAFRMNFPNGDSPRITIPDMKFDPMPVNISARDAYVDMTFTYKASSYLIST